jgi:hypothetical protein
MRDARWQMMPTALVMVEDCKNARRFDATRCRLRFFEKTEAETRWRVGGVGRPAPNEGAGSGDPRPTSEGCSRGFAGICGTIVRPVGAHTSPKRKRGSQPVPSLALRASESAHENLTFWAERGISGEFAESFPGNSIR